MSLSARTVRMAEVVLTTAKLHQQVTRLREQAQPQREGGPEASAPDELFEFYRDDQGRDVARYRDPARMLRERWQRMLERARLPRELLDPARLTLAQRYVYERLARGEANAILHGKTSNGKTTVALLALYALHQAGRHVLAARFSAVKSSLEPRALEAAETEFGAAVAAYAEPAVLLLDDVGMGDPAPRGAGSGRLVSEHERRVLWEICDLRESGGGWTWITSNVSYVTVADAERAGDPWAPTLERRYGETTVARLLAGGRCDVCLFPSDGSADFRRPRQAE